MINACVVPATEDSANIIAWKMAQDYDPHGERTIGERSTSFTWQNAARLLCDVRGPREQDRDLLRMSSASALNASCCAWRAADRPVLTGWT